MGVLSYEKHITTGGAEDALGWISASSLPDQDRQSLRRLVERFSGLTFFKEDDAILDQVQRAQKVVLPSWFRDIRKTMACVMPADTSFQIGQFNDWSPRSGRLGEMWWRLALFGYLDGDDRRILGSEGLFPIGEDVNDLATLGMKLDDGNTGVYDFNREDMWDEESNGDPVGAVVWPVFSSYSDFLDSIVALRKSDGEIVRGIEAPAAQEASNA